MKLTNKIWEYNKQTMRGFEHANRTADHSNQSKFDQWIPNYRIYPIFNIHSMISFNDIFSQQLDIERLIRLWKQKVVLLKTFSKQNMCKHTNQMKKNEILIQIKISMINYQKCHWFCCFCFSIIGDFLFDSIRNNCYQNLKECICFEYVLVSNYILWWNISA